jgi:hypothetical protein
MKTLSSPPMSTLNHESATSWRHLYLVGVSRTAPHDLALTGEELETLFTAIGTRPVVGTGAAFDPRLLINDRGISVWGVLYVALRVTDPEALRGVAEGRCAVHVPPEAIRPAFSHHVQWPAEVLARHDLRLPGLGLFVLPFVQFAGQPAPAPLAHSLRLRGGEVELMALREFDEEHPEQLLAELAGVRDFIRSHRPDLAMTAQ